MRQCDRGGALCLVAFGVQRARARRLRFGERVDGHSTPTRSLARCATPTVGLCLDLRLPWCLRLRRPRSAMSARLPGQLRFRLQAPRRGADQRLPVQARRRQRRQRLVGDEAQVRRSRPNGRRCASRSVTSRRPGGRRKRRSSKHSAKLEFTLASGKGGKGSACFDALTFDALPPPDDSPLTATLSRKDNVAARYDLGSVARDRRRDPALEAGRRRGCVLRCRCRTMAQDVAHASTKWRRSDGGEDFIALPEARGALHPAWIRRPATRRLRRSRRRSRWPSPQRTNDFLKADRGAQRHAATFRAASSASSRTGPIVGVDGGHGTGPARRRRRDRSGKGGFSVEPFVLGEASASTGPTSRATQIAAGRLPADSLRALAHDDARLDVTAFASRHAGDSRLVARYRLTQHDARAAAISRSRWAAPLAGEPADASSSTPIGGVSPITRCGSMPRRGRRSTAVRRIALRIAFASRRFDARHAFESQLAGRQRFRRHVVDDPDWPGVGRAARSTRPGARRAARSRWRCRLSGEASPRRPIAMRKPRTARPRREPGTTSSTA